MKTHDCTVFYAETSKWMEQLKSLKSLLDAIPKPLFYKDTTGRFIGCNKAFEILIGHPPSEIIDHTVYDLVRPETAEVWHQWDQKILKEQQLSPLELKLNENGQPERIIILDGGRLAGPDQRVLGIAGVIYDITSYRSTELALEESQEELRIQKDLLSHIISNIPAFVFWKDRKSRYLGCNEVFAKSAGVDYPEDLIGKSDYDLIWQNEAPVYRQDDQRVMEGGEQLLNFEEPQTREDGSQITLLTSKVPLKDPQGSVIGVLGIYTDITERKALECQQVELLKNLEQKNQELIDFAHIVSHDLKAPLRGIRTLGEWLVIDYADKLGEEGRKKIELIVDRAERMRRLIDGILQYSRLGHTPEERIPVDFGKLVNQIISDLAPPNHISITIDCKLPTLVAESTCVQQVFQNLISNAIKHMDKTQGEIHINGRVDNGMWVFSVRDNGIGIAPEHFERIFQIFQTLSSRETSDSTGVGLTVTKKIVESHGGTIWVESEVGQGSTFYFTLPQNDTEVLNAGIETDTTS